MDLFVQQIFNGLLVGSTYALVAVGFALTFSVLRVINLAHPEFFMISMYVGYLVGSWTQNFVVVILVSALAAGLLGIGLERLVLRPLRNADLLMPLIATAGVAVVLQSATQWAFGSRPVAFPDLVPFARFSLGPVDATSDQLVTLGVSLSAMIGAGLFVKKSRLGLATRAVAENRDIAASFGVSVSRLSQLVVVISVAVAGLGGVTIAQQFGSVTPFIGLAYGLKAFVCMLVAGNRHIEAVMVVGLGLGVLESLTGAYVSSTLRDAVAFSVLIFVLFYRPLGLFGSYQYAD